MADPIGALSDWIIYALGVVGLGGGGGVVGYVRRVDGKAETAVEKATRVERRQIGDPDDPNAEGVLDIAHETRQKVDRLETRMEREHREVMTKLEEMSNGQFEADGD